MTEIKTAQAWGPRVHKSGRVSTTALSAKPIGSYVPCVVVHGLTEAEVLESAALLAKSREVCVWTCGDFGSADVFYPINHDRDQIPTCEIPKFCPSCGRNVVVK